MTTFVCANLTDFLYSISATIRSTDDENTEGQIDFLNSVIVDMQRKNDQLAAKMELLESAGTDPNIFLIFKNVISLIFYFFIYRYPGNCRLCRYGNAKRNWYKSSRTQTLLRYLWWVWYSWYWGLSYTRFVVCTIYLST